MTGGRVSTGDEFRHNGQQGAAAVEFAIVIVILMLVVGGIVEFGRVFWCYDALTKATRDGARLVSAVEKNKLVVAVTAAKTLVREETDAARLIPPLATDDSNVSVSCDYAGNGSFENCTKTDASGEPVAPMYVKVAIVSYVVNLGEWFPIWLASGSQGIVPLTLAPETVMRYMR